MGYMIHDKQEHYLKSWLNIYLKFFSIFVSWEQEVWEWNKG